jgi:hypothetical protein
MSLSCRRMKKEIPSFFIFSYNALEMCLFAESWNDFNNVLGCECCELNGSGA